MIWMALAGHVTVETPAQNTLAIVANGFIFTVATKRDVMY